jgi:hypothetical protein
LSWATCSPPASVELFETAIERERQKEREIEREKREKREESERERDGLVPTTTRTTMRPVLAGKEVGLVIERVHMSPSK